MNAIEINNFAYRMGRLPFPNKQYGDFGKYPEVREFVEKTIRELPLALAGGSFADTLLGQIPPHDNKIFDPRVNAFYTAQEAIKVLDSNWVIEVRIAKAIKGCLDAVQGLQGKESMIAAADWLQKKFEEKF